LARNRALRIFLSNWARADKAGPAQKEGMALDIRLTCLKDAINENWADLTAYEADGKLVVRLKDGVEAIVKGENEEPEKGEG